MRAAVVAPVGVVGEGVMQADGPGQSEHGDPGERPTMAVYPVHMMIAVIIPTYNESGNIIRLLDALRALNIPDLSVWVVDDASPDGSGRLADSYASTNPQVSVIHRSGKLGLGSAYLAGFRAALHAGAEVICEMDADLSHDPNELPMLIEAVETGADAVVGSRKIPGGRFAGHAQLADQGRDQRLPLLSPSHFGIHRSFDGQKRWLCFSGRNTLPSRTRRIQSGRSSYDFPRPD